MQKSAHYTRPGQAPFDEHRYKVTTLTVEMFGYLGKRGTEFVDQLVKTSTTVSEEWIVAIYTGSES